MSRLEVNSKRMYNDIIDIIRPKDIHQENELKALITKSLEYAIKDCISSLYQQPPPPPPPTRKRTPSPPPRTRRRTPTPPPPSRNRKRTPSPRRGRSRSPRSRSSNTAHVRNSYFEPVAQLPRITVPTPELKTVPPPVPPPAPALTVRKRPSNWDSNKPFWPTVHRPPPPRNPYKSPTREEITIEPPPPPPPPAATLALAPPLLSPRITHRDPTPPCRVLWNSSDDDDEEDEAIATEHNLESTLKALISHPTVVSPEDDSEFLAFMAGSADVKTVF